MPLILVGLGLGDCDDITVKGKKAVEMADRVFLESYTSILAGISADQMSEHFNKPIELADRSRIEEDDNLIIAAAAEAGVVLLVAGDPLCATTHVDLLLRAKKLGIDTQVISNTSIVTGISLTGLEVYRFGEVVSIPFFEEKWRPYSFYEKIKQNIDRGLHTLCLLDIKVKEQTEYDMMKGNNIYKPPRFMTTSQGFDQILEAEAALKLNAVSLDTYAVAVARIGSQSQKIIAGTISQISQVALGAPLHSLVICGKLSDVETEFLKYFEV
eukprot:GHVO01070088.1.p1 GENE.GHVO01070088.1~~GHVO01070088.1.p1  ORF type:complete len:270 (+),score=48.76 GHVO01070088.1:21-830(+)